MESIFFFFFMLKYIMVMWNVLNTVSVEVAQTEEVSEKKGMSGFAKGGIVVAVIATMYVLGGFVGAFRAIEGRKLEGFFKSWYAAFKPII